MRERPYRRGLHAKQPTCLLTGVPEGLGQHQRCTLAGRQRTERTDRQIAVIHLVEDVTSWTDRDGPTERDRRPPIPAAELVHRGAVQVPRRIVHRRDRLPSLQEPRERLLGDVLGLGPASGDHAHDLEESILLRVEEVFERDRT